MTRRLVALALWTYFAWYLGATVASLTGGPAVAGPAAALLMLTVGSIGWLRSRRSGTRIASRATAQATR